MSVISLDAVIEFNPTQKPTEIELNDVDMLNKTAPPDGISFYYGFKESLAEESLAMRAASKAGRSASVAKVDVDIAETFLKAATPEIIPNTRFLNLSNISKALEMDVQRIWKDILKKENIDQDKVGDSSYWRTKNYLIQNPQLVGHLRQYEQFAHLEVIAYPFENPAIDSFCKRATLFSDKNVVKMRVEAYPEIELKLSKLNQKKASFKP